MQRYTNIHKISTPLAVWLAHDDYDFKPSEKSISVTTLLKSTREIILTSRLTQSENTLIDISELFASRLGQAVHKAIEQAWLTNCKESLTALGTPSKVINAYAINPTEVKEGSIPVWLEYRTERQIAGWTVSGCADMIKAGSVHDVKSTGTFAYMTGSMNVKYRAQLSIYSWLNPDKITEPMGYIEYIFKDWDKLEAGYKSGYPQLPFLQQPIPLLTHAQVEKFLHEKIQELEKYKDAPQEEIPLCTPEELWSSKPQYQYRVNPAAKKATKNFDTMAEANQWALSKGKGHVTYKAGKAKKCKYCPVKSTCDQYASMKAQGTVD